jgi:hypothetical protein
VVVGPAVVGPPVGRDVVGAGPVPLVPVARWAVVVGAFTRVGAAAPADAAGTGGAVLRGDEPHAAASTNDSRAATDAETGLVGFAM